MSASALKQRVVVKIGSSILTDAHGQPNETRIAHLAEQVASAMERHHEVLLVSSGAIAWGMARLALRRRPKVLAQLQACAAIGQGELMRSYSHAFAKYALPTAQVLLTQADFTDRRRCQNAKHTLQELLVRRAVPIINENDVVAVEEIAFGDNDKLSAHVACLVRAHLLVVLSDVDGLLHEGRVIERVERLDHHHEAMALGPSRETTTGGMASKLSAARIVLQAGIPMVIANGTTRGILADALDGASVGTLFVPQGRKGQRHGD